MTGTIRACVINLKISYRQLSMPKDLTIEKQNVYQRLSRDQHINIHHSCSCKLCIVYTQDGVVTI